MPVRITCPKCRRLSVHAAQNSESATFTIEQKCDDCNSAEDEATAQPYSDKGDEPNKRRRTR